MAGEVTGKVSGWRRMLQKLWNLILGSGVLIGIALGGLQLHQTLWPKDPLAWNTIELRDGWLVECPPKWGLVDQKRMLSALSGRFNTTYERLGDSFLGVLADTSADDGLKSPHILALFYFKGRDRTEAIRFSRSIVDFQAGYFGSQVKLPTGKALAVTGVYEYFDYAGKERIGNLYSYYIPTHSGTWFLLGASSEEERIRGSGLFREIANSLRRKKS